MVVTGGAGFIGSHLVDRLCDAGHEVVVIDNLDPAAHDGPPEWLHPDAQYLVEDVRDPEVWAQVLPGADAVSHQAAKVGLGVDLSDIRDYVDTNDVGTATMLLAMHHAGWRGRLVVASSMVVYGEGRYRCAEHGVVAPAPRRVEDLEAGGSSRGARSCGAALVAGPGARGRAGRSAQRLRRDEAAPGAPVPRLRRVSTTWPSCALRYHNVYGPRMPRDTPYAGVASIFRSQLAAGDGTAGVRGRRQLRDFVHVTDVARANELALLGDEPARRRAQRRVRHAGDAARDGPGARRRRRSRPRTGRHGPVPDRRRAPRHGRPGTRRASASGSGPGSRPADGLVAFASDPLRRPPRTA